MKKEWRRIFLPIGIFSFNFCIGICSLLGIPEKIHLHGSTKKVEKPFFQMDKVWDGSYQATYEKWFSENYFSRNFWVKNYNSILYAMGATNNTIVTGRDEYLFENGYINSFIGVEYACGIQERYDEYAKDIKNIQNTLATKGKPFVYIISPSKAEIYHEYLPEMIGMYKNTYNTYHDMLVKSFCKYNVKYYDTDLLMKKIRNTGYNTFYKSGLHWNMLAAAETLNAISEQYMQIPKLNYKCIKTNSPYGADADLYLLENIWQKLPYEVYYSISLLENPNKYMVQPRIAFLGTSFSQQLTDLFLDINSPFDKVVHYRYLQLGYEIQNKVAKQFELSDNPEDNGLLNLIQENEIIVFETNASVVMDSHIKIAKYLSENIALIPDEQKTSTSYEIKFCENGNSSEYYIFGLYDQEKEGCWSDDKVKFEVNLNSQNDIVINFIARFFQSNYKVKIYCNGKDCGYLTQDQNGNINPVIINKSNLEEGRNAFTFVIENIASPNEIDNVQDTRKLGIYFQQMNFDIVE